MTGVPGAWRVRCVCGTDDRNRVRNGYIRGTRVSVNADAFQDALRTARKVGGFRGTVYLTCENARCAVHEIVLKVSDSQGAMPFQWPLLCCRCREALTFYELH
jgi:hypothetical protein